MQETQIINVHATPATQPWLSEVFACTPLGAVVKIANDPTAADISLRLGEPEFTPAFTYQIDADDVLIITHRQNPVQNLTDEEVRELFAGVDDSSVQVWVYAPGDDAQQVFEQAVMRGRSVTSQARLAASPGHMSDVLVNEVNAVGILSRRWKTGDVRDVFTIPNVPVLALVNDEPQGTVLEILSCMQK